MNREQFTGLLMSMHKSELYLNQTKGVEYAGEANPFGNLDYVAEAFGVSPLLVCGVYLEKHLASIRNWIRATLNGTRILDGALSEPIEGRFDDARLYLALMRGLMERERDREGKDKREIPRLSNESIRLGREVIQQLSKKSRALRDGPSNPCEQHIASSMGCSPLTEHEKRFGPVGLRSSTYPPSEVPDQDDSVGWTISKEAVKSIDCSPSPRATQMDGGVIRPEHPTPRVRPRLGELHEIVEARSDHTMLNAHREDLSEHKAPQCDREEVRPVVAACRATCGCHEDKAPSA